MGSFKAGKVISAAALNRAERLAERGGMPATGFPLQTVRSQIGNLSRSYPPDIDAVIVLMDGTTVSASSSTYYSANIVRYDADSSGTGGADLSDGDQVWVIAGDGTTLSPMGHYVAVLVQPLYPVPVSGQTDIRPLFATMPGGSGISASKVRILGDPILDTRTDLYLGSPVNIYYWPAIVEKYSELGDLAASRPAGDYDPAALPDGSNYVWLTAYFQPGLYGAWCSPPPQTGELFEAVDMGSTVTLPYTGMLPNFPNPATLELWQTMYRKESAILRIIPGVSDPITPGNLYVTDNSNFYFLCVFEGFDPATTEFDYGPPPYVWLVPYWQPNISGSSGYLLPTSGSGVNATDMHVMKTLQVTLPDTSQPMINAEVFQTTDRPTPIGTTCSLDGSGNPITVILWGP